MIGFPPPATATLRADQIAWTLKPLVAQRIDQQRVSRIPSVYASWYTTRRGLEVLPKPQAVRSNRISKSLVNQLQPSGNLGRSPSRFPMDAMPLRSMSITETAKKVCAEAGRDLISFINASPTRKITHEVV